MKRPDVLTAIYPGSFDPITAGHEDIARRALGLADRVVVAVARTASQAKKPLFSVEERLEMLEEVFGGEDGIECTSFEGLLVDFARNRGAQVVVRGLRAVSDFEYEFQLAQMNRQLWPELETVFLTPGTRHTFLSASIVREVARLGGDVTSFVAPQVAQRLAKAFNS